MSIPNFVLPNYSYRVNVLDIIDGDTIDVAIDVGFYCTLRKRLRLLKVNTWEVKGKDKEKGILAKEYLKEQLTNADQVVVQTEMDATGKYGRLLAWVWVIKDQNVSCMNKTLIDLGHGVEYM